MQLNKYQIEEKQFLENYYAELIGATIEQCSITVENDGSMTSMWPTFIVKLANQETRIIEISQDPEGNAPGFIFGLSIPKSNKQ